MLTERPGNRLPTTWERNQVTLSMREGAMFRCPWTGRKLSEDAFDIDHVVPVAVHPFHELWNLVPADPDFNQHKKRDRLPGTNVLRNAIPLLAQTYATYGRQPTLANALRDDVDLRFAERPTTPTHIAHAVANLTESIASLRNVARF